MQNISPPLKETDSPSAPTRIVRSHRGISLIEILVIVVVVSILFVLLLSAYQRNMIIAGRTQCASSLKQIGSGIFAYVADHNGSLPGPGRTALPFLDYASTTVSALLAPYILRPDFDYALHKDEEITLLRCPALKMRIPNYKEQNITITYTQNWEKTTCPFGYILSSNDPSLYNPKKISYFSNPSRIWCIADVDAQWIDQLPDSNITWAQGPVRHGTVRNYLFLDGHVEPINASVSNPLKPFGTP